MTDHTGQTYRLNDLAQLAPETVNATWVMSRGVKFLLAGRESLEGPVALAVERVAALRAALAMFTVLSGGLTHESDSLAATHARSGAKHTTFRHVGLFFLVALLFRTWP